MVRNCCLVVGGILVSSILALLVAHAQDRAMSVPPAFSGGVFVTPVPGEPFTAVAEQDLTQTLKDGTTFHRTTKGLIARDSRGRIHNEARVVVPITSTGEPPLLVTHIYDPDTRLNTFLNPYTHIARQSTLSNPPVTAPPLNWAQQESAGQPADPNARFEDLGTTVSDGISVHGYRRILSINAKLSGTGQAVTITDEYWYSEELHLNMQAKHSDPRSGDVTVTVTQFDRNEPRADLFEIPPSYKLVDVTPE